MIQAVLLFLLLIVVLGVGAKWLRLPDKRRSRPAVEQAARCPTCRSFVVGRRPSCERGDCPYR